MAAQYSQWRADALRLINEFEHLAADLGRPDIQQRTRLLTRQLNDGIKRVAVVGAFNAGKTSLINRLIGAPLLPVSPIANTRLITAVLDPSSPFWASDHALPVAVDVIEATGQPPVQVSSRISDHYSRTTEADSVLCVQYAVEAPHTDLIWIDTPGIGIAGSERIVHLMPHLPLADAIIVVLHAIKPLGLEEMDFIQRRMWENGVQNLFFAVNKIDLIPNPTQQQHVLTHVQQKLTDALGQPPRLYLTSTFDDTDSQIDTLRADLLSFLGSETAALALMENTSAKLQNELCEIAMQLRTVARLQDGVDARLNALEQWGDEPTTLEQKPNKLVEGAQIVSELASAIEQQPLTIHTPVTDELAARIPTQPSENAVFISYKREDWEMYVKPLVRQLLDAGLEVWVDQYSIPPGSNWLSEINRALMRCSRLVLCVTPRSLASRHVENEYGYFNAVGKPFFPILCEGESRDLPPTLIMTQFVPYDASGLQRLIALLKH